MKGNKLSVRENYLKTIGGEWGEWIPYHRAECDWIVPAFFLKFMATPERRDMFGVPWVINDAGPMPDTTRPPIESMADWRDTVELPDLDAIDWPAMAEKDLANVGPDKLFVLFTCQASACSLFLPIMAMVGFEEGLLSFYEEPEAVHEFCECLTDFYVKLIDYEEKYYDPPIYLIADDLGMEIGPLISYDIYEEFLRPYYKRIIDKIKSYGKIVEFHMCGKTEVFANDLADLGIDIWQQAQAMNDHNAVKAAHPNLVFNGGWDSTTPANAPNAAEEVCRQEVRDTIDRLVPLGPFIFFAPVVGSGPEADNRRAWICDEVYKYGPEALKKLELGPYAA